MNADLDPSTGDDALDSFLRPAMRIAEPPLSPSADELVDRAVAAVTADEQRSVTEHATRRARAPSVSWSKLGVLLAEAAAAGWAGAVSAALCVVLACATLCTLATVGTVPGRAPAQRLRSRYRAMLIARRIAQARAASEAEDALAEQVRELDKLGPERLDSLAERARHDHDVALAEGHTDAAGPLGDLAQHLVLVGDRSDEIAGRLDTVAILTGGFALRSEHSPREACSRLDREALRDSLAVLHEASYDLFSVVVGTVDLGKRIALTPRPASVADWAELTTRLRDRWLDLSTFMGHERRRVLRASNSLHRLVTAEWLNTLGPASRPGPVLRTVVAAALLRTRLEERPGRRSQVFDELVTSSSGRTRYAWRQLAG